MLDPAKPRRLDEPIAVTLENHVPRKKLVVSRPMTHHPRHWGILRPGSMRKRRLDMS
jgi:hypothetical protein